MTDLQLNDVDFFTLLLLLNEIDTSLLEARQQHLVLSTQDPRHGVLQVRRMLDLVGEAVRRLVIHLRDPLLGLFHRHVAEDDWCGLLGHLSQEFGFLFVERQRKRGFTFLSRGKEEVV